MSLFGIHTIGQLWTAGGLLLGNLILLLMGLFNPTAPVACGPALAPVAPMDICLKEYEQPPQPVAGWAAVQDQVEYPCGAPHVEGEVFVEFMVDESGTVHAPRILRSLHPDLDVEAVRVIGQTPFTPARKGDQPVARRLIQSFTFSLD